MKPKAERHSEVYSEARPSCYLQQLPQQDSFFATDRNDKFILYTRVALALLLRAKVSHTDITSKLQKACWLRQLQCCSLRPEEQAIILA